MSAEVASCSLGLIAFVENNYNCWRAWALGVQVRANIYKEVSPIQHS